MTEEPAISFKAVRVDLPSASGVAIDGEVDVAAVPALERALEAAIEATAGGFVVDLSGVEFMDSSGLLDGGRVGLARGLRLPRGAEATVS